MAEYTTHRQTITLEYETDDDGWVRGNKVRPWFWSGDLPRNANTMYWGEGGQLRVVEYGEPWIVKPLYTRNDLVARSGGYLTHRDRHFGPWQFTVGGGKVSLAARGGIGIETVEDVLKRLNDGTWKFVD